MRSQGRVRVAPNSSCVTNASLPFFLSSHRGPAANSPDSSSYRSPPLDSLDFLQSFQQGWASALLFSGPAQNFEQSGVHLPQGSARRKSEVKSAKQGRSPVIACLVGPSPWLYGQACHSARGQPLYRDSHGQHPRCWAQPASCELGWWSANPGCQCCRCLLILGWCCQDVLAFRKAMLSRAMSVWRGLHMSLRIAPTARAELCTYFR